MVAEHDTVDHAPLWERLPYELLDAAVGTKIRHELGLDQAHILITAAAPIHPDLIRWFHAIGLPLLELYGQTEVVRPDDLQPARGQPDRHRRPRPSRACGCGSPTTARSSSRAATSAMGYFHDAGRHRRADRRATAGCTPATSARSTPTGTCASPGARRTSSSPPPARTSRPRRSRPTCATTTSSPRRSSIGEGRRYLTALLALDGDALSAWAQAHDKIANYESLAVDPDLRAEIDRIVDEVNGQRSRVEHVRKYRILAHELTIAGGELTPTLKVKRNVVNDKYADLIDEMYAEE